MILIVAFLFFSCEKEDFEILRISPDVEYQNVEVLSVNFFLSYFSVEIDNENIDIKFPENHSVVLHEIVCVKKVGNLYLLEVQE